jgi:hypothetical protein
VHAWAEVTVRVVRGVLVFLSLGFREREREREREVYERSEALYEREKCMRDIERTIVLSCIELYQCIHVHLYCIVYVLS